MLLNPQSPSVLTNYQHKIYSERALSNGGFTYEISAPVKPQNIVCMTI